MHHESGICWAHAAGSSAADESRREGGRTPARGESERTERKVGSKFSSIFYRLSCFRSFIPTSTPSSRLTRLLSCCALLGQRGSAPASLRCSSKKPSAAQHGQRDTLERTAGEREYFVSMKKKKGRRKKTREIEGERRGRQTRRREWQAKQQRQEMEGARSAGGKVQQK